MTLPHNVEKEDLGTLLFPLYGGRLMCDAWRRELGRCISFRKRDTPFRKLDIGLTQQTSPNYDEKREKFIKFESQTQLISSDVVVILIYESLLKAK